MLPTPEAVLISARTSLLAGRQREGRDAVVRRRRVEEAAPGRRDDHVLAAVAAKKGARGGMGRGPELHDPEFLAGLGVERAEAAVVGCADEHNAARRHDRAAV